MHPIRFFRIVSLHSKYMLAALTGLGVLGIVMLSLDVRRGMDASVPLALLHMFSVSSGFAVPARRGHFDLLLTTGTTRLRIAIVHWLMSIAPGVAVWLVLGFAEWVFGGAPGLVLTNGTVAAMTLISMLGWALTVPLPRLSGGVIWLVALFIVLAASGDWRAALLDATQHDDGWLETAIVFLLCPLFFVGTHLEPAELMSLAPGFAVAVAAMVAACAWLTTFDVTLEAAQ